MYCAEWLCTRKTYMAWRNMRYRAGYSETMIGAPPRHSAMSEFEHVGRFCWNSAFGTSASYVLTDLDSEPEWSKNKGYL